MGDQQKWFKVWKSIVNDSSFQNIGLEDIGRWTLLGALMCEQGNNGKLTIIPPANLTLFLFRVSTLDQLKTALKRLPNVLLDPPLNDNGNFTVTMLKWHKYQVDSTTYERIKRLRLKIREDKIRKEGFSLQGESQHQETAGKVDNSMDGIRARLQAQKGVKNVSK